MRKIIKIKQSKRIAHAAHRADQIAKRRFEVNGDCSERVPLLLKIRKKMQINENYLIK